MRFPEKSTALTCDILCISIVALKGMGSSAYTLGFLDDMDIWAGGYRKGAEKSPFGIVEDCFQSAQLPRSPTQNRHSCAGSYSNGKQTPLSYRSQGVEMSH